jgi:hypothetical protein
MTTIRHIYPKGLNMKTLLKLMPNSPYTILAWVAVLVVICSFLIHS